MTDVVSIEQIVREHKNVSRTKRRISNGVERSGKTISKITSYTNIQHTYIRIHITIFRFEPLVCVTYLLYSIQFMRTQTTNDVKCVMCFVNCELISGVVCLHVQETVYLYLFCFVFHSFISTYKCMG